MMKKNKLGVWLIGAYGAVSTCTILGALALKKGLIHSTGMVTGTEPFDKLELVSPEEMVFGGWDIRSGSLLETAELLSRRDGIIAPHLLKELTEDLKAIQEDILPGTSLNSGVFAQTLHKDAPLEKKSPLEEITRIQEDLRAFQASHSLERVVVVNLASTLSSPDFIEDLIDLSQFKKALQEGAPMPSSVLYAYGALDLAMGYLNFTPSPGSEIPALQELALLRKVPHMGKDGKTGETLIKTVLAPMFAARNFEVLSWVGYNILGNMDGQALEDPESNRAKVKTKGSSLKSLIPSSNPTLKVGIDYVPSLGDWKTAWDFIHFQGFMNTKMSLQFTWQGSDSMLAAPLVLDLVRLLNLSWDQGQSGLMAHLASFFKFPLGVESHNFYDQFKSLMDYIGQISLSRQSES